MANITWSSAMCQVLSSVTHVYFFIILLNLELGTAIPIFTDKGAES